MGQFNIYSSVCVRNALFAHLIFNCSATDQQIGDGQSDKKDGQDYGKTDQEFFKSALAVIAAEITAESAGKPGAAILEQDGNGKQDGNDYFGDIYNAQHFKYSLNCLVLSQYETYTSLSSRRLPVNPALTFGWIDTQFRGLTF